MKSLTLQIGIFGATNIGKSSLINFITNQQTSIVSAIAGTTTDVVQKQMELNPLGPITLFDTAGLNDDSVLGKFRIEKSLKTLDNCDVVMLMCGTNKLSGFEKNIIEAVKKRDAVLIIVVGKTDLNEPESNFLKELKKYSKNILLFSKNTTNRDNFLNSLKKILIDELPENYLDNYCSLKNIIKKDDTIILIMPIDAGAPRGKIIMPQIQILRQILNLNACSYTIQVSEYENALKNLNRAPALVITDSQVIGTIGDKTPKDVKLTTFSIIYSADKSDIVEMARGAKTLNELQDGDKILIAEACSHHASKDDIGKVKIPKWIRAYSKKNLEINYISGQDYPANISDYKLIMHCGGCVLNRKAMLARLNKAVFNGVAITNYGMAISVFHGYMKKTLELFPNALKAFLENP
jgi:[FeFe] hydrogenase H-cluster maturation GTPase HydF